MEPKNESAKSLNDPNLQEAGRISDAAKKENLWSSQDTSLPEDPVERRALLLQLQSFIPQLTVSPISPELSNAGYLNISIEAVPEELRARFVKYVLRPLIGPWGSVLEIPEANRIGPEFPGFDVVEITGFHEGSPGDFSAARRNVESIKKALGLLPKSAGPTSATKGPPTVS
jgi:hypothetical protein